MAGRKRARLIVLIGLPGAGKSTLAAELCRRMRLARIDRDALRLKLFPRARFTGTEKAAANAAVWRAVRARLARRHDVVVDGMTFADAAQRRRAQALARRMNAECVPVWLDCPLGLALARVRGAANHLAGDRTPGLVREVAARFAPVSRTTLRVDARTSARAQARRVVARLSG